MPSEERSGPRMAALQSLLGWGSIVQILALVAGFSGGVTIAIRGGVL